MYDVIVVGAGPAGASAAWHLATAGVRVLLVDRSHFPRTKVCGDGVTPRGVAVTRRMGIELQREPQAHPFRGVRAVTPRGLAVDIPLAGEPILGAGVAGSSLVPAFVPQRPITAAPQVGFVVPRLHLDALLVERAVAAGVELRTGVHIGDALWEEGRVVGVAGHALGTRAAISLRARLVIAADGSAGGLSARLGLRPTTPAEAVAVRAYYSGVSGLGERLAVSFRRDFLPYYGWVFPMAGGGANVGVFLERRSLARLPLERAFHSFGQSSPWREVLDGARLEAPPQAFPLRMHFRRQRAFCPGALAVGDAAGVIHPLTGEGIANALESGLLAGRHALQALATGDVSRHGLAPYGAALQRAFGRSHWQAALLRVCFHGPLFCHLFFAVGGRCMAWS